jgi:hypothetical protein
MESQFQALINARHCERSEAIFQKSLLSRISMLKFAANLSLLFPEYDFLDRFQAAADSGFKGVEIQFPYAWDP